MNILQHLDLECFHQCDENSCRPFLSITLKNIHGFALFVFFAVSEEFQLLLPADLLRKIFVVDDIKAWSPSLRAKSVVRTSDTRYFIDPSIATAALSIGPGDLMGDLRSFGYFFASRSCACPAATLPSASEITLQWSFQA